MSAMFVYVTAGSLDEARLLGRSIVAERLAACANVIDGMQSFYWWQGKLKEGREAVVVFRTVEERVAALTQRVRQLHGYKVPCVVALPIAAGNPAYLDWIAAEARDPV
jgi:periplasmic divalent cation tolerance protein